AALSTPMVMCVRAVSSTTRQSAAVGAGVRGPAGVHAASVPAASSGMMARIAGLLVGEVIPRSPRKNGIAGAAIRTGPAAWRSVTNAAQLRRDACALFEEPCSAAFDDLLEARVAGERFPRVLLLQAAPRTGAALVEPCLECVDRFIGIAERCMNVGGI